MCDIFTLGLNQTTGGRLIPECDTPPDNVGLLKILGRRVGCIQYCVEDTRDKGRMHAVLC